METLLCNTSMRQPAAIVADNLQMSDTTNAETTTRSSTCSTRNGDPHSFDGPPSLSHSDSSPTSSASPVLLIDSTQELGGEKEQRSNWTSETSRANTPDSCGCLQTTASNAAGASTVDDRPLSSSESESTTNTSISIVANAVRDFDGRVITSTKGLKPTNTQVLPFPLDMPPVNPELYSDMEFGTEETVRVGDYSYTPMVGGRSSVWKYYRREFASNGHKTTFVLCILCKERIRSLDASTSGMRTHLKSRHNITVDRVKYLPQPEPKPTAGSVSVKMQSSNTTNVSKFTKRPMKHSPLSEFNRAAAVALSKLDSSSFVDTTTTSPVTVNNSTAELLASHERGRSCQKYVKNVILEVQQGLHDVEECSRGRLKRKSSPPHKVPSPKRVASLLSGSSPVEPNILALGAALTSMAHQQSTSPHGLSAPVTSTLSSAEMAISDPQNTPNHTSSMLDSFIRRTLTPAGPVNCSNAAPLSVDISPATTSLQSAARSISPSILQQRFMALVQQALLRPQLAGLATSGLSTATDQARGTTPNSTTASTATNNGVASAPMDLSLPKSRNESGSSEAEQPANCEDSENVQGPPLLNSNNNATVRRPLIPALEEDKLNAMMQQFRGFLEQFQRFKDEVELFHFETLQHYNNLEAQIAQLS